MVATDLDQTLIYSPGASARGRHRPSRVVEVLEGRTISLLSHDAERDLHALAGAAAALVPVTTRTRAQYERVDLRLQPQYAVVASGAVLLVDGEPDLAWSQDVARRLGSDSAPVGELEQALQAFRREDRWLLRLKAADDVFLVAAVEADLLTSEALERVTLACTALGWRAVHQGRKLYVLPRGLDKAAAVAEVARRLGGEPLLLAAGDTDLDRGMLALAHQGWFPAGSELDRLGYKAPHVQRTQEAGLAAAEEILASCLAVVRG